MSENTDRYEEDVKQFGRMMIEPSLLWFKTLYYSPQTEKKALALLMIIPFIALQATTVLVSAAGALYCTGKLAQASAIGLFNPERDRYERVLNPMDERDYFSSTISAGEAMQCV